MYALVLLYKPCKFPASSCNFGVAGLNLGRWAEKEQAWGRFTRLLGHGKTKKVNSVLNTSKIILPHGFKYDQNKTSSNVDFFKKIAGTNAN